MQQLVARIKRQSKYWGQTAPNQWFEVSVIGDASYQVRGNDNNYRLADLAFGVRIGNGTIVDLTSGKESPDTIHEEDCACSQCGSEGMHTADTSAAHEVY